MTRLDRRRFLQLSGATTVAAALSAQAGVAPQSAAAAVKGPKRGLLLYVDHRLEAAGEEYEQRINTAVQKHPLLSLLAPTQRVLRPSSEMATWSELSFNHVMIIALADDPLLARAWQREANIQLATSAGGAFYAFGFGHLEGSIGYIESDRNPFLHSPAVSKVPYEAECVSITGTDPSAVGRAADAFLEQSLVNGLIAAPGWRRGAPTLLDRDPLSPDFPLPASLPLTLGPLRRIALTQVAEDVYRGVLADTTIMPKSIWQAKYYAPGQWDLPGQVASFNHYSVGLHRRAYGNSILLVTFASPAEASSAAPRMAAAAKLSVSAAGWAGALPPYAWGLSVMGDAPSTGRLALGVLGESVLLSSITSSL